ncbi:MAG: hypothetical protein ABSF13_10590 [Smithella sp.]
MNKSRECNRCLMTSEVPGVTIGPDGLCSVCRDHDSVWNQWLINKDSYAKKLEEILRQVKKKRRPYDVLIPLSGGKDSTYVLYMCKKQFGLRCLAYTCDNGFLQETARDNIKHSCDILRVDHVYYTPNKPLLDDLYRYFFLKTGFLCPVCMRAIGVGTMRTQIGFDIPLCIQGTSRRTEEHISDEFFVNSDSFIENILAESHLANESDALLSPVGLFRSPVRINLPDFIEWNYNKIYNTLRTELDFKETLKGAEHDDCQINSIVDYFRYRKWPSLVPGMLRYSKMVTSGQISREAAIKMLPANASEIKEPSNLDWFLKKMNITRDDMETILSERMMHMPYTKTRSRVARRLKAIQRRFVQF